MEQYIKNFGDITYLSELTPHHFLEKGWVLGFKYGVVSYVVNFIFRLLLKSGAGFNSHI